jgi:hypothetical protein
MGSRNETFEPPDFRLREGVSDEVDMMVLAVIFGCWERRNLESVWSPGAGGRLPAPCWYPLYFDGFLYILI